MARSALPFLLAEGCVLLIVVFVIWPEPEISSSVPSRGKKATSPSVTEGSRLCNRRISTTDVRPATTCTSCSAAIKPRLEARTVTRAGTILSMMNVPSASVMVDLSSPSSSTNAPCNGSSDTVLRTLPLIEPRLEDELSTIAAVAVAPAVTATCAVPEPTSTRSACTR